MSRDGLAAALACVMIALVGWAATNRMPNLVAGGGEVQLAHSSPARGGDNVQITVPQGANGAAIARQMEQAGVISDAGLFRTLSSLMGVSGELAAGQYEFPRGLPATEAIQRLRTGETFPTLTLTLPEGLRNEEIATLVEKRGLGSAADFLAAAQAPDFPYAILQGRPPGGSVEGYLFPDTYFFTTKATPRDVAERLLKTMDERFDAALRAAAQAQGLTPHQALTLASIVEREAQVAEERPLIAAAFLNRIRQGIPLQADPTVQYAVSANPASVQKYGWWKKDLTEDDLKTKSPYSTYANAGLPPGPICNPGLASIRAVANPAPVKYVYFVAKGDGTHAFAETLDEHNRNVARYQR